jgi:hypothetical protein
MWQPYDSVTLCLTDETQAVEGGFAKKVDAKVKHFLTGTA